MRRIYLIVLITLSAKLSAQVTQSNKGGQEDGRILSADSIITVDKRLDSLYQTLPEVMIVGERPIVKATQGKLVYDLPRIISNLPVDNVYDAVKELPGIAEIDNALTIGGQSVTVVLDGKVTTMTTDQLNSLLKSIPASRIEKAEVMYSAPARYQVRGALINVCLKHSNSATPSLQGELYSDYRQNYYEALTGRASLLYSARKFSADFLYSYTHGRSIFLTDKEALHTLADGSVQPMNTDESQRSRGNTHNARLGVDYNFSKDHRLSLVYTGNFSNGRNYSSVSGSQTSETHTHHTGQLHNGRLDYQTPFGLKAGAELTYYQSPSSQLLHSQLNDERLDFLNEDNQRINRWKFFLAQEHSLGKGWGLNYGVVYNSGIDHSYQYFYDTETGELLSDSKNMKSRRREETWNFYAGFNKSFSDKLSLDVSIAAEQYHTQVWDEWNFFPALNLNYTPSAGNVWQLSLTSDKTYPDYWATQDVISYLGGGYSEIHGNPLLKPSVDYQVKLTYILKGKYMFSTWFTHEKNDFKQTLYQSPERLVEIYKCFNSDFGQQVGLQSVIPFSVNKWLNTRFTLIGVYQRQKDSDFWDIPYDRQVFYGIAVMNNTFTLSTKPDLKFVLSGMIRSKAIQGIYDLPVSGNLDIALRYAFAKGKAILSLRCKDLLETGQISPRIHFATQNVDNHYSAFREFGVSFTYKFGGYKEKQREGVDTSRFK